MPDRLSILRERLLRAGLSPARVHRYVGELRDHLDDLTGELQQDGLPSAAAQAEAWRRLGSYRTLTLPLLVDRGARSLASRLPWLAFLVLPALAGLGFGALLIGGLIVATQQKDWLLLLPDIAAGLGIAWLAGTLAGAWLVQIWGMRHRAAVTWPLLGAAALAALGVAMQLSINLPQASRAGEIAISLVQPAPLPAVVMLALAALPLLAQRVMRGLLS